MRAHYPLFLLLILFFIGCEGQQHAITLPELEAQYFAGNIKQAVIKTNDNYAEIYFKVPIEVNGNMVDIAIYNFDAVEYFEEHWYELSRQAPEVIDLKFDVRSNFRAFFIQWSFLLLIPITFILYLAALISILRNKFESATDKLIWVIVVIFLPFLGSILYFSIGRKQTLKSV
ncbi:MAG: PLD nuclease N-terminal domain-containing protein [Bacteroidota bacterium]